MKLIVVVLVIVALLYVSPTTFDGSLRVASEPDDVTGAVTSSTTLSDDRWYRLLYVDALSVIVVAVPLVAVVGVCVSLPRTALASRRSAELAATAGVSWRHEPAALGARQVRGHHGSLQRQLGGSSAQLNDIIKITSALAASLLVAYAPQVSYRCSYMYCTCG